MRASESWRRSGNQRSGNQRDWSRSPRLLWAIAWLVLVPHSSLSADEEEDDAVPYLPGLVATWSDAAGGGFTRLETRPSVAGEPGASDERLGSGPYRVKWSGRLWVQQPGTYRFAAFVAGQGRMKLGERIVLDVDSPTARWHVSPPMELDFDHHLIELDYATDGVAQPSDARFGLYWSGSTFPLESIPSRFWMHDRSETPSMDAERGRDLARALRCAACHDIPGQTPALDSPSLDRVEGNLRPEWLRRWLVSRHASPDSRPPPPGKQEDAAGKVERELERRMPHFDLTEEEASDLAAYLLERSHPPVKPRRTLARAAKTSASKNSAAHEATRKEEPPDARRKVEEGLRIARTVGCLACHTLDGLGTRDLFDGGELTRVRDKRPRDFVARWLADPATANARHRMPWMELSLEEAEAIAAALDASPANSSAPSPDDRQPDVPRGAVLFGELGCANCHRGPDPQPATTPRRAWSPQSLESLVASNDRTCLDAPATLAEGRHRPGYHLSARDRAALVSYLRQLPNPREPSRNARDARIDKAALDKAALESAERDGHRLLRELRCTACHARDESAGIADVALEVTRRDESLSPLLAALSPPSLTGVGDKLRDEALDDAIRRNHETRRPWLVARMPRYGLTDASLRAVREALVSEDRIPEGAPVEVRSADVAARETLALQEVALRTTGGRLVTPDGFGCTSCHAVGAVQPPPAPLNARGPNLARLGERIRPAWFDRWVRNPARIVPRMEMPSVQLPVRGVLDEQLDRQLAAVWHVLNLPDFTPPEPNPVQTLRLTGDAARGEQAEIVTDVVHADGHVWVKPLLLGLPNRHNLLFDLDSGRLARWSLGDLARQRTKGKTWYWEAAGIDLFRGVNAKGSGDAKGTSELALAPELSWEAGESPGESRVAPRSIGQFQTDLQGWHRRDSGVDVRYRIEFPRDATAPARPETTWSARVVQRFEPFDRSSLSRVNGFRRTIEVDCDREDARLLLGAVPVDVAKRADLDASRRRLTWDEGSWTVELATEGVTWSDNGQVELPVASGPRGKRRLALNYLTTTLNDRHEPAAVGEPPRPESQVLEVAPGFVARRLPLDERHMPTALAWRPDGSLIVGSLKGRVLLARDLDRDGMEDSWTVFSDELAAPYGVSAAGEAIDVVTKYAVLRLRDADRDGRADQTDVVAAGWGHTADYHDWAVGLPGDGRGGYFLALPCQQDKRSEAAAHLRGTVLHLAAEPDGLEPGERFRIEVVSGGHRFPMGLARRRDGELFVTDNQGNYNPFNELNHVLSGRRYGFINAIEQRPDFKPPTESPAIEIPHPWTRSVNGICFLEAPPSDNQSGAPSFGPFTGHLVGCEYDTRRLVRMSLQRIGETFQGAVYPLTFDQPREGGWLLGPISCAVSPRGELYVGGIRDSGWGGGNNHGEVVRLTFDERRLPPGIAEMRATEDGFEIDWTRPLDPARLSVLGSYHLSSYRRVSTPAYGGNDVDRREETIARVTVDPQGGRVRLHLAELRRGFVYELRVRELIPAGEIFHPSEAHFTLRDVPNR